jgi:hypothetical protein
MVGPVLYQQWHPAIDSAITEHIGRINGEGEVKVVLEPQDAAQLVSSELSSEA